MGNVDVYWLSTLKVALDPAIVTLMSWTNLIWYGVSILPRVISGQ